jgi:hypothetical protein
VPTEPGPEDKETARSLYQRGHDRFRAGDFHGALAAFEAAHRIMGAPTTGLELGRTEAKLGLLVEARDHLLKVERDREQPGEPDAYRRARQEAKALADELVSRIPSITIEALGPSGSLMQEPSLRVLVDAAELIPELREIPRSVNPGPHMVQASARGYAPQRQTVLLKEGEQRVFQLALSPSETEPATGPDAAVLGDAAPSSGARDRGSAAWPVAWAGFALGGAGLLAGVITGGLTLSQEAELATRCPEARCPASETAALDGARTLGNVSTASFVIGGVGVGVGLVALLVALSGDDAEDRSFTRPGSPVRPAVALHVGRGELGLGLRATF